ncbi:MAG: DUF3854 domain-containing protein [Bacteroidota bacterium]
MAELTPWARQKLASSALPDATIELLCTPHPAGGQPYVERPPRRGSKASSSGIALPYWTPAGDQLKVAVGDSTVIFERLRLSDQLICEYNQRRDRSPIPGLPGELQPKPRSQPKYLSPRGTGSQLYHSHIAILANAELYQQRLNDVYTPLRIVEGELKAESLTFHSPKIITVALGGVWNWKDRRDGGEESSPIPELSGQDGSIPLANREIRLCFDSDTAQNTKVQAALRALGKHLIDCGARVLHEVLPAEPSGEKNGPDDLIYRHGPEAFQRIQNQPQSAIGVKVIGHGKDAVEVFVYMPPQEPAATNDSHRRAQSLLAVTARTWVAASNRAMHQWTGTHWAALRGDLCEPAVQSLIHQFRIAQGWRHCDSKTITSWRQEWQRGLPQSLPQLHPDLQSAGVVPCLNGLLRLDTAELLPHSPAHGNTWRLEIPFIPTAPQGKISALLQEICGPVGARQLMAAIACTIRGTIGKRKLFIEVFGPGDCGKSLIALIVQSVIGLLNSTAGTLEKLESRGERFETARYEGQRLAIFNEAQRYSGPLEMLKAFTGRDLIPAEIKNGALFEFVFHGLVLLIGNSAINAQDNSDAVLNRRLQIGPLDPIPKEKQDPDLLYVNRDTGELGGRLVEHLPGFLLEVLSIEEQEAGKILAACSRTAQQLQNEVDSLTKLDPVARFIEDHTVFDPDIGKEEALNIGSWTVPKDLRADGPSIADDRLFVRYCALALEGDLTLKKARAADLPGQKQGFKQRIVLILRDQLRLPMPPGKENQGEYRHRTRGSVMPCLRWRTEADDKNGVPGPITLGVALRHQAGPSQSMGSQQAPSPPSPQACAGPVKALCMTKTPVGADREDCEDLSEVTTSEGDKGVTPHIEASAKRSARSARSAPASDLVIHTVFTGPSRSPGDSRLDTPAGAETIGATPAQASPALDLAGPLTPSPGEQVEILSPLGQWQLGSVLAVDATHLQVQTLTGSKPKLKLSSHGRSWRWPAAA